MVKVYTPTSKYSKIQDTKIEKQSLITGLMFYGTRITRWWQATSTGGTDSTTIYTVPEGKTFFLMSAYLNVSIPTTENRNGTGWITAATPVTTSTGRILYLSVSSLATADGGAMSRNSLSIAYNIPIRYVSGEVFQVSAFANNTSASGGIAGYEIDNTLLQNFY